MVALPEFCLMVGLLLSLLLPLYASVRFRAIPVSQRPPLTAVWLGQFCLAMAGIAILTSRTPPVVCLTVGIIAWGCCGWAFRKASHRLAPSTKPAT